MNEPAASSRLSGAAIWRGYTQAELDAQYDVEAAAGEDGVRVRKRLAAESARVRKALGGRFDVPYGTGPRETLDIFPAPRANAPIVVCIHGGYWRAGSKEDVSVYAERFVPAGCAVVAVEYALAPHAPLEALVDQCRRALAWTVRHATGFNGDPARIHLIGRSAGGHLGGMVLATDWPAYGVSSSPIVGATLISGIYDLEPVMLSRVNEWARLDRAAALRLSPIRCIPVQGCPLIAAWGGAEPDEFRRQSRDYAAAWAARGYPCATIEFPDAHHFVSMAAFADPDNPLTRAVLAQIGT